MSRKPVYNDDNNRFRIVSVANDQWQAQHRVGEGGSPTDDPWRPLARPTSRALAEAQMNERAKHAKRAA